MTNGVLNPRVMAHHADEGRADAQEIFAGFEQGLVGFFTFDRAGSLVDDHADILGHARRAAEFNKRISVG